jgi:Pvc16 N-terminal domain
MASVTAMFDIGDSVVTLLQRRRKLLDDPNASAESKALANFLPTEQDIGSWTIRKLTEDTGAPSGDKGKLAFICYRVLLSGQQRHKSPSDAPRMTHLGVDLFYLLCAWGADPRAEQTALAWAMLELQKHPTFDTSLLNQAAAGPGVWQSGESIHLQPDLVTHEAIFKIWEALQIKYRLSAAYVVRALQLGEAAEPGPPVVSRRLGFTPNAVALEVA